MLFFMLVDMRFEALGGFVTVVGVLMMRVGVLRGK